VELLIILVILSGGAFFAAGAFLSRVMAQFFLSSHIISLAYTVDILLLLPVAINLIFCLFSLVKKSA
jgi:hypothetical protein